MRNDTVATDKASWILIADSDRPFGRRAARHLSEPGCGACWTPWGGAALAYARLAMPVLGVIDVQLDDMTGYSLVAGLRDLEPDLPIIMTCGEVTEAHEVRARQAGLLWYGTKPVDLERLRTVVLRAALMRSATC